MDKKRATVIFIITMFVVVAAWDVFVIATAGFETSISHTMIVWSYKYPIFPFLMGIVCGHLFWRMGDSKDTKEISDYVHGKNE